MIARETQNDVTLAEILQTNHTLQCNRTMRMEMKTIDISDWVVGDLLNSVLLSPEAGRKGLDYTSRSNALIRTNFGTQNYDGVDAYHRQHQ